MLLDNDLMANGSAAKGRLQDGARLQTGMRGTQFASGVPTFVATGGR